MKRHRAASTLTSACLELESMLEAAFQTHVELKRRSRASGSTRRLRRDLATWLEGVIPDAMARAHGVDARLALAAAMLSMRRSLVERIDSTDQRSALTGHLLRSFEQSVLLSDAALMWGVVLLRCWAREPAGDS